MLVCVIWFYCLLLTINLVISIDSVAVIIVHLVEKLSHANIWKSNSQSMPSLRSLVNSHSFPFDFIHFLCPIHCFSVLCSIVLFFFFQLAFSLSIHSHWQIHFKVWSHTLKWCKSDTHMFSWIANRSALNIQRLQIIVFMYEHVVHFTC